MSRKKSRNVAIETPARGRWPLPEGTEAHRAKRALGIIALPPVGRSLAILLAHRCSLIIDEDWAPWSAVNAAPPLAIGGKAWELRI
jgi:hypothetical protein